MASKSKKRHVHISDADSEESFKASQRFKSSVPPKKPYVPRFLTIHSEEETYSSLSPFIVHNEYSW